MNGFKRRSTIHDLASLRLHPDGTKVASTSTNSRPRKAKYVRKDPRGNWIAHDAGGLGSIKLRREIGQDDEDLGAQGEEGTGTGAATSAIDKGKARGTPEDDDHRPTRSSRTPLGSARAKRRKAFADDLGFLESQNANVAASAHDVSADLTEATAVSKFQLPVPSSVSEQLLS